jgi:hypothetical protein
MQYLLSSPHFLKPLPPLSEPLTAHPLKNPFALRSTLSTVSTTSLLFQITLNSNERCNTHPPLPTSLIRFPYSWPLHPPVSQLKRPPIGQDLILSIRNAILTLPPHFPCPPSLLLTLAPTSFPADAPPHPHSSSSIDLAEAAVYADSSFPLKEENFPPFPRQSNFKSEPASTLR